MAYRVCICILSPYHQLPSLVISQPRCPPVTVEVVEVSFVVVVVQVEVVALR